MDSCLFCRIAAGEIPAKQVYADDDLVVIEDINPVAPIHLLVIPRRHTVNCLDLTEAEDRVIGRTFRVAARIAREKGIADAGFRLVNNNNAGAGQSVFHIHFHLLGGRNLTWPPG